MGRRIMNLHDLLQRHAERMPMLYARGLKPRIEALLAKDLEDSDRRQLEAVNDALSNPELKECAGLDRLHFLVERLEARFAVGGEEKTESPLPWCAESGRHIPIFNWNDNRDYCECCGKPMEGL